MSNIRSRESAATATEHAKRLFDTWKNHELNIYASPDSVALQGGYLAKGAEILANLAAVHHARAERGEKPKWWEFIFRTKRAKEYSAEKKLMTEMVKTMKERDPSSDFGGLYNRGLKIKNRPLVYDEYLKADTFKEAKNAEYLAIFSHYALGRTSAFEEDIAYGELDKKLESVDYDYLSEEEKAEVDFGKPEEVGEREPITYTKDDLLALDGIGPDAKEDPNASIDSSLFEEEPENSEDSVDLNESFRPQ